MILRYNVGDTISRSVQVNNVNNVSVNITAFVNGDLENSTTILNPKFTLAPGESRDVNFTMKVTQNGTTTTKINVAFSPVLGYGGGVGLSSTVIVIAQGDSITTPSDGSDNNGQSSPGIDSSTMSFLIWVVVLIIVVVVFVLGLIFILKKGSNKEAIEEDKEAKLKNKSKKA